MLVVDEARRAVGLLVDSGQRRGDQTADSLSLEAVYHLSQFVDRWTRAGYGHQLRDMRLTVPRGDPQGGTAVAACHDRIGKYVDADRVRLGPTPPGSHWQGRVTLVGCPCSW